MATTIRLQRKGTRNAPFYHIVVADSRRSATKQYIERVGYYDPAPEKSIVELKSDRIQYWFGKGAVLSNSAKVLMKLKNVELKRDRSESKAPAKKPAKAKK